MFTDLLTGRGTENVLFNLLRYKPSDIDVKVISTMRNYGSRISDSELKNKLNNARVIKLNVTVNNKWPKFNAKFSKILKPIKVLINPALKDFRKYKNTEILQEIRDTDVVYLFYNPYSIFFYDMNIPIIGSNHTERLKGFNPKQNLLLKIFYKIYYRIYFKNITGLHVFPNNKAILDYTNFKYKMVLPNGVDASLYYPDYNVKNKKLRLFFVATLEKGKGLDILLPLIDQFKNNNEIEFHIAGTGSMVDEVKKRDNMSWGYRY